VGLWQERLAAVQAVGCSYADSTLAFKLLGEKFPQIQIRALRTIYGRVYTVDIWTADPKHWF
jgi:hypothetical protein